MGKDDKPVRVMEYNAEFFQYQTRPIIPPLAIDQTIQYLFRKKEKNPKVSQT